MAHSWGTVIGLGAALKRPDLFYAYVGIGQVINTRDNERISFEYGLQQAKAHGNATAVKELESIAPYPGDQPITRERIILARKWAQFYGGLSAYREESRYFFNAPLLSPEYSAADVCAVDQGNVFTLGRVLPEFLNVDYKGVRSLSIPIFMFMGRHDYTTPAQPTADWLAQVRAPAQARCVVRALLAYDSVGRARQDADEPGAERTPAGRARRESTLTIRMSFARFVFSLFVPLLAVVHGGTVAAFDFDDVAELAQLQARQPYRSSGRKAPAQLQALNYDQYRDIRFRPDRAMWRAGQAAVRGDVLPSRQVSEGAVRINEVTPQGTRHIPYRSADFDFGKNKLSPQSWGDLGFAGFRVHYPLNGERVQRRARRVPRRELLPRARRRPALRPVGARPGDRHRRRPGRRVPGVHRVLDREARGRRHDADALRAARFAARDRRLSVRRPSRATRR